jgi:hypothetical protein
MTTELPIACTLDAGDYRVRLDDMAAVGRAALIDADATPRRASLRFAADTGVRERVDALVAAESQCCAFLAMTVTEEADIIVLTVEAPDGAAPVLAEIVEAFHGRAAVA